MVISVGGVGGGLPVALDEVMGIAEAEAKELLEARA